MRIGSLLVLVLILFSAGCVFHRAVPERSVNITDDLGHTVKVPVPVRRIVSLAPGETEIVGVLGRTDLLVGRCSACNWPPEVLNVPVMGGGQEYRVETVMARDPDLILATPREDPKGLDELRRNGYAVLVFAPETIDGIYRNIRTVGQAIGEEQNASRVVVGLQLQENAIREKNRNLTKVRAIYVLHDDPLYVAGT